MSWFEANPRKAKLLIFCLCLLAIEGLVRVLVWVGLLPYQEYQTDATPTFWAYNDPVVGRWHYPNVTVPHKGACIDVVYQTNSAGMRDPERSLESDAPDRAVLLGDSFVEGFGVNHGERMSDVLEQRTGIEHLNFATGDTGTIQHWLTYQRFAQNYDHTRVFQFILPGNDFTDNDPDHERWNIYRPFLKKTDSGFEVYYFVDFEDRWTGSISLPSVIKNTIDNNLYIANVLRWATRAIKGEFREARPEGPASDYDSYSPEDMEIMLYALARTADLAGARPVYLVVIPTVRDLEYAADYGTEFRLIEDFAAFAESRNNVYLIDLMPFFLEKARESGRSPRDFTLGCDEHWNAAGQLTAAEALLAAVYAENGAESAETQQ